MKNYFFVLVLGFLLSFSNIAYATSGACSYHGGVNCSAGATITGNVQCNDGWVNSSVLYISTDECRTQNFCIPPQSFGYRYTVEAQCYGLEAQAVANGNAQFTPDLVQAEIQDCRNQVNAYQIAVQTYNNCLSNSISFPNIPSYSSHSLTSSSVSAPLVTTTAGTNISQTSATLNGTATINASQATTWFEYGITPSYGQLTSKRFQGSSGLTVMPMSGTAQNLQPSTTYNFRAVGSNNAGTSYGSNQTFKTLPSTTPLIQATPVITLPEKVSIKKALPESMTTKTKPINESNGKVILVQDNVQDTPPVGEIKAQKSRSIFDRLGDWLVSVFQKLFY